MNEEEPYEEGSQLDEEGSELYEQGSNPHARERLRAEILLQQAQDDYAVFPEYMYLNDQASILEELFTYRADSFRENVAKLNNNYNTYAQQLIRYNIFHRVYAYNLANRFKEYGVEDDAPAIIAARKVSAMYQNMVETFPYRYFAYPIEDVLSINTEIMEVELDSSSHVLDNLHIILEHMTSNNMPMAAKVKKLISELQQLRNPLKGRIISRKEQMLTLCSSEGCVDVQISPEIAEDFQEIVESHVYANSMFTQGILEVILRQGLRDVEVCKESLTLYIGKIENSDFTAKPGTRGCIHWTFGANPKTASQLDQKLSDFVESMRSKKQFVLFPFNIHFGNAAHATVLLIHFGTKCLYRFDPNGSISSNEKIDEQLTKLAKYYFNNLSLMTSKDTCPLYGPQMYLAKTLGKRKEYLHDTCIIWSLWFINIFILHFDTHTNPEDTIAVRMRSLTEQAMAGFEDEDAVQTIVPFVEEFIKACVQLLNLSKVRISTNLEAYRPSFSFDTTPNDIVEAYANGFKNGYVPYDEDDFVPFEPIILRRVNNRLDIFPYHVPEFFQLHSDLEYPKNFSDVYLDALTKMSEDTSIKETTLFQGVNEIDDYEKWRENYVQYVHTQMKKINYNLPLKGTCYCSDKKIKIGCVSLAEDRKNYKPMRVNEEKKVQAAHNVLLQGLPFTCK